MYPPCLIFFFPWQCDLLAPLLAQSWACLGQGPPHSGFVEQAGSRGCWCLPCSFTLPLSSLLAALPLSSRHLSPMEGMFTGLQDPFCFPCTRSKLAGNGVPQEQPWTCADGNWSVDTVMGTGVWIHTGSFVLPCLNQLFNTGILASGSAPAGTQTQTESLNE